jgi:hypothetical protein
MKKILSALFVASLALCIGNVASAQNPTAQTATPLQVKPSVFKPFVITTIKGEISVPAQFSSGNYGNGPVSLGQAGFGCSNIVVVANSKETKPKPPNAGDFYFPVPVWTKSVQATGNFASGKCNYSLAVPGDQQFGLVAGTTGQFNCDSIMMGFGNTTPTWQTVPKGTIKTDNLSISAITCIVIG